MIGYEKEFDLTNKLNSTIDISKKSNGSIRLPFNYEFKLSDDSFNSLYLENLITNENELIHSLENIIGKEKLNDLFMSGNTTGFINELKKHRSELFVNKIINSQGLIELEQNIIQYNHEINLDIELNDKNSKLYTTFNNQQYPNLYANLVMYYYILNQQDFSDEERIMFYCRELFDIRDLMLYIDSDILKKIHDYGINILIEELKKYLNEEDIYSYLELLNKEDLSMEERYKINDYQRELQDISLNDILTNRYR